MRLTYLPDGLPAPDPLAGNQDVPVVDSGDDVAMTIPVAWPGDVPTSSNTLLEFVLSDTLIDGGDDAHVALGWQHGLSIVDTPQGLVLRVPLSSAVTGDLRRGSYAYAATLSSLDKTQRRTVAKGNLMIDYTPASPHRDIPYR